MTSLTTAEPVRAHVQMLRSAGASWQAIASAAGVGAMTVFDLMHCSAKVSKTTAEALLAVSPGDFDCARVDANGAMLRLRSLQAMGHGSARVARAIGCHEQSIQRVVNGRAKTISAELHQGIAAVFAAWWDKTPPEQTPSERAAASAARRRAMRSNWCQGAALDGALLDTPGYRPRTGYRRAIGTGIAPEIHLNHGRSTPNQAVKDVPRPSNQAVPGKEYQMSERVSVRSADCFCEAASGTPCTPNGDHLERYVRAAKQGTIDRQTLKEAVSGLEVIAPQAIVPSSTRTADRAGMQPADRVVRSLGRTGTAHAREASELEAGA